VGGARICASFAPKTFDTEDGVVVILDPEGSSLEELQEAELNCPSGAIRVRVLEDSAAGENAESNTEGEK
jgi:ferredoxin